MNTKINAETAAKEIKTEETVSVYVPSEGVGPFLEGALNGVSFRIPTDTVVEVPRRIARILSESRRELVTGARAAQAYTATGGRKIG
ncbi:MAG: hypothetical protein II049_00915 [Clostridia bacterium]|nr:hypothetical protein [Clostridia bacterium]